MKQSKNSLFKLGLLIILLFTLSAGNIDAQDKCCNNAKKCEVELDKMPEPIGGLKGIMQNVKYPAEAKEKDISGKVFVSALIDVNGDVKKTKVIKSDNKLLNKAAVDAVVKTKFKPAEDKGEKVKAEVVIPISFRLK